MKVTDNIIARNILITDYVPLQVRTDREIQEVDYYCICKEDRSFLELTFDQTDHTVCRITLVICSNYHKVNAYYNVPTDIIRGDVLIDSAGEVDTSCFDCFIYKNAVKIIVSDLSADTYISSGNIIWELTSQGNLVSISVIDTTGQVSVHCEKELQTRE